MERCQYSLLLGSIKFWKSGNWIFKMSRSSQKQGEKLGMLGIRVID